MTAQDDARENIMVRLFNLKQEPDRARHDPDAFLNHEGHRFQFELKSTTKSSVSTVRDFGLEHIQKWLDMHWIVGFFKSSNENPQYCYYLAPLDMKEWTDELWASIKTDFEMAEFAANRLTVEDLYNLVGEKNIYTLADAKALQKSQYTSAQYSELADLKDYGISCGRFFDLAAPYLDPQWLRSFAEGKSQFSLEDLEILVGQQADTGKISAAIHPDDKVSEANASSVLPSVLMPVLLPRMESGMTSKSAARLMRWPLTKPGKKFCCDIVPGYSKTAMLEILKDRCRYLIRRGSTLNNPHIPARFFTRFDKITDEHASELRKRLSAYLLENPPQELLGEATPS